MENDIVTLNVDPHAVKPIIQKAIQAAIVENLGKQEDLIETMVGLALKQKVNEYGNISKESYYNKYDFLETLTNVAIQNAAKEAIKEWLETKKDQLKNTMLKELQKPSRQKSLIKAFADAAENSFKCSWNFHCKIEFAKGDD